MSNKILVLGEDSGLGADLRLRGWDVRSASGADEARHLIRTFPPDVVVAGMGHADAGALDPFAGLMERLPDVPLIAIVDTDDARPAEGRLPAAIPRPGALHARALRAGAYTSLPRPLDPDALNQAVWRWHRERRGDGSRASPLLPAGVRLVGRLSLGDLSGEASMVSYVRDVRWRNEDGRVVLELALDGASFHWDQYASEEYAVDWTPGVPGFRWRDDRIGRAVARAEPAVPYVVTSRGHHRATVLRDRVKLDTGRAGAWRVIEAAELEDVAFSPDGRILLARQGTSVRMWRCDTGEEVARLPTEGIPLSLGLFVAPDLPVFATATGWQGEVVAWEYDPSVLLSPPASTHPFEVFNGGVRQWNAWRRRYPSVVPRLGAVNCTLRDLSGINLRGAGLARARLRRAALRDADLCGADLRAADLREADLRGARLVNADLSEALAAGARLDGADLTGAILFRTDLTGATLRDADLSRAVAYWTVFGSNDLSATRGLDLVTHEHASILGIDTLRSLAAAPPLAFLRGSGLSAGAIRTLPQLLTAPGAVEHHSCFISYAHEDRAFAERLRARLDENGVTCWMDAHQMLPGDDVYDSVAGGIRDQDKVLLCASRASLTSWWVDSEIAITLEKEQRLSREHGARVRVLIPLDLDGYLLSGEWHDGKASEVRRRLAPDFREWQTNEPHFEAQLARLMDALRVKPGGGPA